MQSTTTFDRIVHLYDQARMLLDKEEGLTEDEQRQFADIRDQLDRLWTHRRAELVFQVAGPPRMISAPDPSRRAQIARGIQPLPSGGD